MLKSLPKEQAGKSTVKPEKQIDPLVERNFSSHRHRKLQMGVEILPMLDIAKFLERCVLGEYKGFSEPERILKDALKRLDLKPVRFDNTEDLRSEKIKEMQNRKNRLKRVLHVISDVVTAQPAAYPNALSHYANDLSSFIGEVDREYAYFTELMRRIKTEKAELDLLELYRKNPCIWFFVHAELEKRGIRPDYTKVDTMLSREASTRPS